MHTHATQDVHALGLGGCQGRIPETTLSCIRHIRQIYPEAKISVEVEKPGREGLRDLAAAADLVFYSRSWAEVIYHHPSSLCWEGRWLTGECLRARDTTQPASVSRVRCLATRRNFWSLDSQMMIC
jgi:hypothetical protein